jgi:hypothetical protein
MPVALDRPLVAGDALAEGQRSARSAGRPQTSPRLLPEPRRFSWPARRLHEASLACTRGRIGPRNATRAPSLHGRYPASSLSRAHPPPARLRHPAAFAAMRTARPPDLTISRLPMRSLPLRPGDSLTTPRVALSMGSRSVGLPSSCHPSYRGFWFLPPVGLAPTERASLRWSHPIAGLPVHYSPRTTIVTRAAAPTINRASVSRIRLRILPLAIAATRNFNACRRSRSPPTPSTW